MLLFTETIRSLTKYVNDVRNNILVFQYFLSLTKTRAIILFLLLLPIVNEYLLFRLYCQFAANRQLTLNLFDLFLFHFWLFS